MPGLSAQGVISAHTVHVCPAKVKQVDSTVTSVTKITGGARCDDRDVGDGHRLLLWSAHAYMPQAKGVLPGEVPIRVARAQELASSRPENKVCGVCGSHLAARVDGLNAASALAGAGLLGKTRVRTLVRTGFAGLHPDARENCQGRKLKAGAGLQTLCRQIEGNRPARPSADQSPLEKSMATRGYASSQEKNQQNVASCQRPEW